MHTLYQLVHGLQAISALADAHCGELAAWYRSYTAGLYDHQGLEQHFQHFVEKHQQTLQNFFVPFCPVNTENILSEVVRNLKIKTRRMHALEKQKWILPEKDVLANLESALKSAFYMHLRHLYNRLQEYQIAPGPAAAIFYFVRENAYASMFRYNNQGEFNVPYGGISYNRKNLASKIASLRTAEIRSHLQNTVIENLDFAEFLQKHAPGPDDFLFLDPPYDSDFSTYTRNEFTLTDHQRLADYLHSGCPAKFILVIKNTPAIAHLYQHQGLRIRSFAKTYLVSFHDRNDRAAEHLLIMNFG
jgi:DNA adenine methylase